MKNRTAESKARSQLNAARGAVVVLAMDSTLGAVAFWAIANPAAKAALPVYLQNPLNCGFAISVVCTVVMWSLRERDPARQGAADAVARVGATVPRR